MEADLSRAYDLCIIGVGSAGFAAAEAVRSAGASVVLIESPGELAGLCINHGCMPAKTVLKSTEIAQTVRDAGEFGIQASERAIDPTAIIERKDRIIREFRSDRLEALAEFPLARGNGRFISPEHFELDGRAVLASRFIVATGSHIPTPPIPGIEAVKTFTSWEAMERTDVPRRLLVLGGGPVGCEFAQYYARLGASVTLVQDADHLLVKEDRDIGDALRHALQHEDRIAIRCSEHVERFHAQTNGASVAVLRSGDRLECDEVFVATGRQPNTAALALDVAGVEIDHESVCVNAALQTSNPLIFAAGDVIGGRCLVHTAVEQGRLAANNALATMQSRELRDYPRELFAMRSVSTQPQVAVVGFSETEARRHGIETRVATYLFSDHGKAITAHELAGFVKLIADRDGTIVGGAYVGAEVVELAQELAAVMYFRGTVDDLLAIPHPHPTLGEIVTYPAAEISEAVRSEGLRISSRR